MTLRLRFRQLLIWPMWVVISATGSGCVDGYPPPQRTPIEPQQMSAAQRMETLNAIGWRAPGNAPWQYRLSPDGCKLEVHHEPKDRDAHRAHYALKTISFRMDYDELLEAFEVRAMAARQASSFSEPVLKAADWADALFAHAVLNLMQRACHEPA